MPASLRLLLVEDNPGDAVIFREKLSATPLAFDLVHVLRLRDGLEALAAQGPFDLIMADLTLPDAQGVEVVRALREAAPDRPLIVLTGLDDATVAAETKRVGATDYLVKWYMDSATLARYVRYAVEQYRLLGGGADGQGRTPPPVAPLEAPSPRRAAPRPLAPAVPTGVFDLSVALDAALAFAERQAEHARRLAGLLRATRELRRREHEGIAPAPAPIDLAALARAAVGTYRADALARGLALSIAGSEGKLPAVADPRLVEGALDRLFCEIVAEARPDGLAIELVRESDRAMLRAVWTVEPGRAPSGDGGDPVSALGLALCDRMTGLAGGSLSFTSTRAGRCEAIVAFPARSST